ncbi:MAG TPA: hypothetical protein VF310_05250 [Vicinamibacteria bacterium]
MTERTEPDFDDDYWRQSFRDFPHADPSRNYEYYQPAYRFGWESYSRYGRRSFEELDEELQREWERARDGASPAWPDARAAAREAWDRAASHQPPRG